MYKISKYSSADLLFFYQEQKDEDIDWWSKFYGSVGDIDKAGVYLEKGYDKIMVREWQACHSRDILTYNLVEI